MVDSDSDKSDEDDNDADGSSPGDNDGDGAVHPRDLGCRPLLADCSRDSLPPMSISQTTISSLSNASACRASDGVRAAIVAPSVGTGSEEPAEVTVFFRVRPEDPLLKSNKKSLLWKYFSHFDTVYHPDK